MLSRIRVTFSQLQLNKFQFSMKRPPRPQNYNTGSPHMKTSSSQKPRGSSSRNYSHFQIGMYGLIVAACFAAIPMYRIFCEHMGLVGDYDKKTYDFKNKPVVNTKKYRVIFQGVAQPGINWVFEPVEKEVVIGASETAIVFYRLRNKEERSIVGFSTYNLAPEEAGLYFSKIQCFCFNQQMINPQEELILPLFFFLQPEINEDPDVSRIKQIKVNYQFYQSSNQDLAKFAEEQLMRVEENKRKLMQMRAAKKNMSVEQYEDFLEEEEEKKDAQFQTKRAFIKRQPLQQNPPKQQSQSSTQTA